MSDMLTMSMAKVFIEDQFGLVINHQLDCPNPNDCQLYFIIGTITSRKRGTSLLVTAKMCKMIHISQYLLCVGGWEGVASLIIIDENGVPYFFKQSCQIF